MILNTFLQDRITYMYKHTQDRQKVYVEAFIQCITPLSLSTFHVVKNKTKPCFAIYILLMLESGSIHRSLYSATFKKHHS